MMVYNATPGHVTEDRTAILVPKLRALMEDPRLLILPSTLTGTSVQDDSGKSHTMTANESVAGWVSHTTRAPLYDLDGSADFLYCADSDDFSFGNSSVDSAFSVFALANSDDGSTGRAWIAKADTYTGHDCEWVFGPYVNGKYGLFLMDEVPNVRIARMKDSVFPSGEWHFIVATYDGGGTSGGIKVYLDGNRIDDTSSDYGSYTAMHNTTQELHVGCAQFDTGHVAWWDGKLGCVGICAKELSHSEVWRLTLLVQGYYGV